MHFDDLSFDPRDPYFPVADGTGADPLPPDLRAVRFAVQIFTTRNVYGLDPARITFTSAPGGHLGGELRADGLRTGGGQFAAEGTATIRWHRTDDGRAVEWHLHAKHPTEPVKVVKLLLRGLPDDLCREGFWTAAGETGDACAPTVGPGGGFLRVYPNGTDQGCVTPWVAAGERGRSVAVSVPDTRVRAIRFCALRQPYWDGECVLEILCEEDARHWRGEFAAPPIRLRACADPVETHADLRAHLAFVEGAHSLVPWEQRSDVPAWARDLRLVLTLHGQHWTGRVFNTFERMAATLHFVCEHIPGRHVLAYLPGWEGRYYWQYPRYQPSPDLGGAAGFSRLLGTARELGVHLMPMFGANGCNAQHYATWQTSHFRDRTDRRDVLINCPDWDADRSGEDDQLFLNPGEPGWRAFLLGQIGATLDAFPQLDAVFLDTTAAWFNDARHNVVEGYAAFARDLHARRPGLLLAGEGFYDALWRFFPFNQTWLGNGRRYRFRDIVRRYGRALPHLSEGTPGPGSTGVHEAGWRPGPPPPPAPGHLPGIGFVDDTLPRYAEEVARRCREAMESRR